jgi:hypothetical protein
MSRFILLAVVATAALVPGARVRAGVVVEESDDGLTVFKMTVTPAAEPTPALTHRLTLRELDAKNGNAVPYYYRAILNIERIAKEQRDAYGEEFDQWCSLETPLEKLPLEKVRAAAAQFDAPMEALREAAVRRDCDWDWQLDSIRGPALFSFLLPEMQQSRELSRALMLRVRLAIAEKRYDDAIDLLRINYKLAGDVAAEPLLINALVGAAEAGLGHRELVELIAAPGSPNLYWAIAELPQPFIDMRRATRFEMSSTFRVFPVMSNAESAEHSPQEWARLFAESLRDLAPLSSGPPLWDATTARMGVAGLALISYGPAKQRLIDGGFDAQRVEQMPVGQVIAVDAGREFRQLADDMERWWYVPYPVARAHAQDVDKALSGDKFVVGFGRILAQMLLPALASARDAQMRLEWQTGGLQTVEAIRMHAAAAGELPASLEEIKVVPVPENPVTGTPYQYRREGDAAIVELPATDGFSGGACRFEISLAD